MKPISTTVRMAARLLVFGVLWVLVWLAWEIWSAKREPNLIISCRNHGNQIYSCLLVDAQETPRWHLPYLPGQEGAMVFAAYGRRTEAHANCNHGAPNRRIGGWQAVNLPPDKWDEVFRRWPEGSAEDGVPLYWCGRPSSKNERFMVTVLNRTNFWITSVTEEKLAARIRRLNQVLADMGERPVPLNVPDNVDWDKAPPWPLTPSPAAASAPAP
jgi:hypothetical protein